MKDIKVVVFDLDGTLYEDTHHFDYYAARLCEKLDRTYKDAFYQDYEAVLKGLHPLKIGMVYDGHQDLILSHKNGMVKEAFTWEGTEVSRDEVTRLYPNKLQFDYHSMINVGDLWWVPSSIARHYGISPEEAGASFIETRKYMMTPGFILKEVPGFKEIIERLATDKKLILLTNSPQEDSEVIISKLGFQDLFDECIYDGQKPNRTKEHLSKIKDHYHIDFQQMLCIGDNAINEITPAKELGCKTILIDPHGISEAFEADIIVRNIEGLIETLQEEYKISK